MGLDESQLIVARTELHAIADQIYVLEAAVEDVVGDLSRSAELKDYEAAVAWLLAAARPLIAMGVAEGVGIGAGPREST